MYETLPQGQNPAYVLRIISYWTDTNLWFPRVKDLSQFFFFYTISYLHIEMEVFRKYILEIFLKSLDILYLLERRNFKGMSDKKIF